VNQVRFIAEGHEYWLGDRRLPSVSEIIAPLVDYSMVPEDRLAFARDRGTAVHRATELWDRGTLDEDSIDAEHVLPYLNAWKAFLREQAVAIERSEEPLASPLLSYAGTPDRVVKMTHKGRRASVLLDIKTVAEIKPVVGVQLGGYELLLRENKIEVSARVAVQLRRDGSYRLHTFGSEVSTFLSLLNIRNWRTKHE